MRRDLTLRTAAKASLRLSLQISAHGYFSATASLARQPLASKLCFAYADERRRVRVDAGETDCSVWVGGASFDLTPSAAVRVKEFLAEWDELVATPEEAAAA